MDARDGCSCCRTGPTFYNRVNYYYFDICKWNDAVDLGLARESTRVHWPRLLAIYWYLRYYAMALFR